MHLVSECEMVMRALKQVGDVLRRGADNPRPAEMFDRCAPSLRLISGANALVPVERDGEVISYYVQQLVQACTSDI